jgi:tetratricopeptide (TPR) repeat protein
MSDRQLVNNGKAPPSAAAAPSPLPKWKLARRRRWLFRLSAMTLVPALILILIELILRVSGYGYPAGFLLRKKVGGRHLCVENLDFGRRFFPTGLERAPLPVLFDAEKPPRTCRIFVLGESAAMGFPAPSFGFARILETLLGARFPNTRFEVVNTAMTAVDSHVVLQIARGCADHHPDLFVVYMGNNEVVGPFGASGILGASSPSLNLIRASIGVKATRTGQLLSNMAQGARRIKGPSSTWNGMEMFAERPVPADDPRMESVYFHFSRNLEDICDAGRSCGAKVVVCTMAGNLKDSPPFGSQPSPDLGDRQATEWNGHFEEGIGREATGDYDGAVACYGRAARIDDQRADLQFRLARCQLAARRPDDARRHFVIARDRDTLRFRADTRINATIRAVASGREGDGVYLADVERAFATASADELPGSEFFYEHVHLTFAGNYILARTVFEKVVGLLPETVRGGQTESDAASLSEEECRQRLAFTEWSLVNSLQGTRRLFAVPPFSRQLDGDERNRRVEQQIEQLQRRLETGGFEVALAVCRNALARNQGDFILHMELALLLMQLREFDEAADHFLEVEKSLPHHPAPHVWLGQSLAAEGHRAEALAHCAEALRLRPGWPQAVEMQKRILFIPGVPAD